MKLTQLIYKFAPLIAFIAGIWYFCIRILGDNLEYIPGDLGDSRFINYLLEHGYRWLTGNVQSFWDGEFMYPFKNSIALSDSMLGTLPFYSIWRFLGFSPESSYQLWWICICSLNYWCSYFVFKKWFNRSDVALVLAWIFAFSVFNLGQLNFMQMIVRFMVPVVFYAAYKMVITPSAKYLLIYCFGIIFQLCSAVYTGFYLLYFSALFVFIYYLISKKWKDLLYYFKNKKLAYTSLIFFLSLLAFQWLLLPYLKMSNIVGLRLYREVTINLPLWNSFLFPHEASVAWGFLFDITKPDVPEWWLHYLFLGIIPLAAIIVSPFYLFYNWYKKIKTPLLLKSVIITSVIIVLIHIRTESGLTLYALIFKLPGINSMKVLTRFMHVEIFILLLIIGYVLVRFKNKYIFLFALFVFADNCFSPKYIQREEKAGLIKRKEILLTELEKYEYGKYKAVALIDSIQPAYITHLDMMLVAQSVGIKSVNGYSSYCPDEFGEFYKNDTEEGLFKWLASQNVKKEKILVIKIKKKD
ncbi:MAG: hypothetical protein PHD97_02460 [Bacteroidales bacterium]|nr:hypothetical protein [Bacteroidales bacterium]